MCNFGDFELCVGCENRRWGMGGWGMEFTVVRRVWRAHRRIESVCANR